MQDGDSSPPDEESKKGAKKKIPQFNYVQEVEKALEERRALQKRVNSSEDVRVSHNRDYVSSISLGPSSSDRRRSCPSSQNPIYTLVSPPRRPARVFVTPYTHPSAGKHSSALHKSRPGKSSGKVRFKDENEIIDWGRMRSLRDSNDDTDKELDLLNQFSGISLNVESIGDLNMSGMSKPFPSSSAPSNSPFSNVGNGSHRSSFMSAAPTLSSNVSSSMPISSNIQIPSPPTSLLANHSSWGDNNSSFFTHTHTLTTSLANSSRVSYATTPSVAISSLTSSGFDSTATCHSIYSNSFNHGPTLTYSLSSGGLNCLSADGGANNSLSVPNATPLSSSLPGNTMHLPSVSEGTNMNHQQSLSSSNIDTYSDGNGYDMNDDFDAHNTF